MIGTMNIRIQVMAQQARRAIAQVQGDMARLSAAEAAGGASSGRFGAATQKNLRGLTSFGNQLQWTGRQLQYNWTLPILAAAAAGAHFQMENEKAMTRLKKVYADPGFAHTEAEVASLEKAFEALSERYGIAQAETIGIAAEWAAAGSSGLALANQTELTMKTMVLGQLEAGEATQALIAIQAQYNQSSAELGDTIARLNNVENQTGTTMGDLIVSMQRSAGVARAAGIDVSHLAAMTAALVPAAGTASQAGNALKTIISRLLSPTGEAAQILTEMGIAIDESAWKSANATTRIELLSDKYQGLSDSQKAVVSATLASRYQINKFEVLMDAIARKGDKAGEAMSFYWTALEAATNRTEYLAQVTRELDTVLDSNPKKWDRIKVIMSNALANVIQPMLPALMAIGLTLADMARSLAALPPVTQKWIGAALLLLVVLPMLTRYIGSLITLFGVLARVMLVILAPIAFIVTRMFAMIAALRIVTVASMGLGLVWGTLKLLAMGFSAALPFIMAGMTALSGLFIVGIKAAWGMVKSWKLAGFAIAGIWRTAMTTIMLFTGVAMSQLPRLIMAGAGALIFGFMALLQPVANLILAWIPIVGAAMARAWTAVMVTIGAIQGVFVGQLAVIWTQMGRVLPGAMMLVGATMQAAWTALHFALAYITVAGGKWIANVWYALAPQLARIQAAIGAALTTAWTAISTALVAIQTVLWRTLILIQLTAGAVLTRGMALIWAGLSAVVTAAIPLLIASVKLLAHGMALALTSPWTWAVLAVAAALYGMRDYIVSALSTSWDFIQEFSNAVVERVVGAFNALPEGIVNALTNVVAVVRDAAMQVYEWLSYLNPFARHSPSLVENVNTGMDAVVAGYSKMTAVKGYVDTAYDSIQDFKRASMGLTQSLQAIERGEDRQLLAKFAPETLASFDRLSHGLVIMRARQLGLESAVSRQEGVVDAWADRLDRANAALDVQKDRLSALEDVASAYASRISDIKDRISQLSSTPITGMGAMEDQIFRNEMAQKRLRLEMLKTGANGGQTYDQIRDKMSKLAGEMEMLTGKREGLRSAGAGSDILGHYDKQINALGKQHDALQDAKSPVDQLQKRLDALQRQAEILDLEKALKFDPLTRAIDKAANSMREMPFNSIIGGIRSNQAELTRLTAAHDQATAAVDRQKAAVDRAQAAVDGIQASHDAEAKKLERIRDLYQETADAVRDMESALSGATGAASGIQQRQEEAARKAAEAERKRKGKKGREPYVSPALQNFRDAAGGNFADVGGSGSLGREGGLGDQSALIDEFTKSIAGEAGAAFKGFDMMAPLRDMWNNFTAWAARTFGPWWDAIKQFFGDIFAGIDIMGPVRDSVGKMDLPGIFRSIWDGVVSVFETVWDIGGMLWGLFGPDIKELFDTVWGFIKRFGEMFVEIFYDIIDRIQPFFDALQNLWAIVKPVFMVLVAWFLTIGEVAFEIFNNVLGAVLDWVGDMFMNLWEIIRGVIDMFIGLFTLDFKTFFSGLGDVLMGLGGIIWDTLSALGEIAIGALRGLVGGIWDAMVWIGGMIWAGLEAGLRAIGLGWLVDVFGAIIDWVKNLFGINSPSSVFAQFGKWILEGLINGLSSVMPIVFAIFKGALAVIRFVFETIGVVAGWLWRNVLQPTFKILAAAFRIMAGILKATWNNVIEPMLRFFARVGLWLWNNVLKPAFRALGAGFQLMGSILRAVWNGVVQPMFRIFARIGLWLWNNILKPTFRNIMGGFQIMGTALKWVWNNVVRPAWDALGKAGRWLWNNILRPAFQAISRGFDVMGKALRWVWDRIIKPAWDAITRAGSALRNTIVDRFENLRDRVRDIFTRIRDTAGRIWDSLIEKVKTPVRIVFTWVNDSMIKPINTLLKKFPGDLEIPPLPKLREGGRVRGPGTGTSDSVLGVDSRGVPTARVSRGEYVVNAKSTQANLGLIDAINRANGRLPGFAGGGLFDDAWGAVKGAAGWAWDKASNAAQWVGDKVGDLVAQGGKFAVEKLIGPLVKGAKALIPGRDIFPTILRGSIDKLYEAIGGVGEKHDQQAATLAGGTFGGGGNSPNGVGGLGPQAAAARAYVMRTFGISNIGGYSYRMIAGTNTLSDHALGKAIDVMISNYTDPRQIALGNRVASYFVQNPSAFGTKYVIWRDQINQGSGWQGYGHPGGGSSDTLQHRDHVHVSFYDDGGMLTGLGINTTGRPERVLTPRQTISFERLVSYLDREGVPSMSRLESAMFRIEARLAKAENIGHQTVIQHQGDNNTNITLTGDLVFPNITDGNDADVFLRNLRDLAGKR